MSDSPEFVNVVRQGNECVVCAEHAEQKCTLVNSNLTMAKAAGYYLDMPFAEVEQLPVTEGLTFTYKQVHRAKLR